MLFIFRFDGAVVDHVHGMAVLLPAEPGITSEVDQHQGFDRSAKLFSRIAL